jgi:hypothetical protein
MQPPLYDAGQQPYQGFAPPPGVVIAPPSYMASQQMQQPAGMTFNITADVKNFSPLSYGSSFIALIRAHRHHNKYVSLDQHMEICFTERPTMHWNFVLSNSRDCYFIVCQWGPAPSPVLQLKVPPTPLFLRASRGANWEVGRVFGAAGPEAAFYLENHGGHFALRNQASAQYVSAEDNCLRANRKDYKDWEKFSIEVLRTEQLTLLTPFGQIKVNEAVPCFDLIMTYHVAFRARVRTHRHAEGLIGLHKGHINFSNNDAVWEFIPCHHRNAFLIRNADHPDIYWTCTSRDATLRPGGARDREAEFELDFKGKHYFFRNCATQRYASAEMFSIVCNRDKAAGWEAFALDVLHQLDI